MSRIPPELDGLMWAIAEENNANAIGEFVNRYPIYREELLRRTEALNGLKTGRPAGTPVTKTIPRFVPREVTPEPRNPRTVAFVSGLVLAALALASFTVSSMLSISPPPVVAPNPAPVNRVAEVPKESTDPIYVNPTPRVVAPPREAPPQETPPPRTTPVSETPKYLQPQELVVKKATLHSVLALLGAQAKIKIVVAPGLPNPPIDVEYHEMNAIEMLKDLGALYRFTAFDQGDGSIVVYPVVGSPAGGNTTFSHRIGG